MTNVECASGSCEVVGTNVDTPVLFEPVSSVADVKPITGTDHDGGSDVRGAFDDLLVNSDASAEVSDIKVESPTCQCSKNDKQFYQVSQFFGLSTNARSLHLIRKFH